MITMLTILCKYSSAHGSLDHIHSTGLLPIQAALMAWYHFHIPPWHIHGVNVCIQAASPAWHAARNNKKINSYICFAPCMFPSSPRSRQGSHTLIRNVRALPPTPPKKRKVSTASHFVHRHTMEQISKLPWDGEGEMLSTSIIRRRLGPDTTVKGLGFRFRT